MALTASIHFDPGLYKKRISLIEGKTFESEGFIHSASTLVSPNVAGFRLARTYRISFHFIFLLEIVPVKELRV